MARFCAECGLELKFLRGLRRDSGETLPRKELTQTARALRRKSRDAARCGLGRFWRCVWVGLL